MNKKHLCHKNEKNMIVTMILLTNLLEKFECYVFV